MAAAGGGWAGQIIGPSLDGHIAFDWVTGLSTEAMLEFERRGGGVPGINPRALAGVTMPEFSTRIDSDFMDGAAMARSPLYQEVFAPLEADFICMSRLEQVGESRPIAAIIRSASQGQFDEDDRGVLQHIAPSLSAALRLRALLDEQGADLAARALEALALPGFVVSRSGRLLASTPQGETILRQGSMIKLLRGRLHAADRKSDSQLQAAISRACSADVEFGPSISAVLLRDAENRLTQAEIARLPQSLWSVGVGPAVLVALKARRRAGSAVLLLRQAFNLTTSEAETAFILAQGCAPAEISERRGVSLETVRSQLKSSYAKMDVRGQAELVIRVIALVGDPADDAAKAVGP